MEGASGVVTLLPLLLSLVTTSWAQLLHDIPTKPAARIAVIGGGIGGTAAAYFLHDLFGDEVLIDLYEPDHIGGRLATLSVAGQEYEAGGSVIHPTNQYMKNFAAQFGLSHTTPCSESVGLFNGEDYVFTSSNIALVDFAKLFLRYGWDVYRLQKVPAAVLHDFIKIYKLQHEGQAFKDVASLLSAMSKEMLRMTQMSTTDWLMEQGFSPLTISELVMSALQCNYGQTPEMHAFVGLIALAGADSNLWSVEGGNKRVAEELLKHSRASLLRRRVAQVAHSTSTPRKFMVWSHEPDEPVEAEAAAMGQKDAAQETKETWREQEYDAVILATPLTQDSTKIQLVNFTQQFSFSGHYELIETTIVRGVVRPESLMLNDDEMLDNILVINPRLMFNSFGRQHPVKGRKCDQEAVGVWKIFSPHKIPEDLLDIFFQRREVTHAISWLAYPHYSTNQTLGDFELAPGLYHLNAIEWAGSAMEMSVIGAKNVALLAYKQWKNDPDAGKKPPIKEEL
uniref:Prenylcysteine lyase domain-containing protein n=1 Tax=Scylla olivacea TaxID=85551 RepID=A0A0P4WG59_SCYOL